MRKIVKALCLSALSVIFIGCASTTRLNFACNDPSVDIYIDGEFAGRDLVNHVFPKGKKTVEVTCMDNGVEVFHNIYYTGSYRNHELIDLPVQRDYQYSTGGKISRTS